MIRASLPTLPDGERRPCSHARVTATTDAFGRVRVECACGRSWVEAPLDPLRVTQRSAAIFMGGFRDVR